MTKRITIPQSGVYTIRAPAGTTLEIAGEIAPMSYDEECAALARRLRAVEDELEQVGNMLNDSEVMAQDYAQRLAAERERADAATRRAEDEASKFDSLCNELEQMIDVRGDWRNKTDRRGAALIQSIGMALEKRADRLREIEQAARAVVHNSAPSTVDAWESVAKRDMDALRAALAPRDEPAQGEG